MGSKGRIGVSIQCLNARALCEFQEPPSQWGGFIGRRAFGYPPNPTTCSSGQTDRSSNPSVPTKWPRDPIYFLSCLHYETGILMPPSQVRGFGTYRALSSVFVDRRAQRRYRRHFYSLTRPLWSAWGYTRQDLNPAGEAPPSITAVQIKTLCVVSALEVKGLASRCNPGGKELEDESSLDLNHPRAKLPWHLGRMSGFPKSWQSQERV